MRPFRLRLCIVLTGLLAAAALTPTLVRADAPPPPPFGISVYDAGGPVVITKDTLRVLTCASGSGSAQAAPVARWTGSALDISQYDAGRSCTWKPTTLKRISCTGSSCYIQDFLLEPFEVAVYDTASKQVFVSNAVKRDYAGHYGSDTGTGYGVTLGSKGQATLEQTSTGNTDLTPPGKGPPAWVQSVPEFFFFAALLSTLVIELFVALIFALIKKLPKRILWGVLISNLVSVPLLWLVVTNDYALLIPAEVAVVGLEMLAMWLFVRRKVSWPMLLLLSFLMNLASFVLGQWIIYGFVA